MATDERDLSDEVEPRIAGLAVGRKEDDRDGLGPVLRLIHFLFDDLLTISKGNYDVIAALFYNRAKEIRAFGEAIEEIRKGNHNILVTGPGGVGKSTFVHRILSSSDFVEEHRMYPLIADYRQQFAAVPFLLSIIEGIQKYFAKQGVPCHLDLPNQAQYIDDNLYQLTKHLSHASAADLQQHLLIVLDDFDYIEHDLFAILERIYGFAVSNKCSVVLTARPPLYNEINNYDDRFANFFTRAVHHVKLKSLAPDRLIARRLGVILQREAAHPIVATVRRIFERDALRDWARVSGITALDGIGDLTLPFDGKFLHFMSAVTGGNIRDMLAIAEIAFDYVLRHRGAIPVEHEDVDGETCERVPLPPPVLLGLFREAKDQQLEEQPRFVIRNLFRERSKSGNALYWNLLEGIQKVQSLSPVFYEELQQLGHSREHVDHAINFLKAKSIAMIEERGIYPPALERQAELFRHYRLTEKGEYYLNHLASWPEYHQAYGEPGRSLSAI